MAKLFEKPMQGLRYGREQLVNVVPEEGQRRAYWWFTRLGITACLCVVTIGAVFGMHRWDVVVAQREAYMYPVEIFFSVFGLMYAIIVGLLIVETHRRWYELSSAIQSEITSIGNIHDCLRYFGEHQQNSNAKKKVVTALIKYVKGMALDWNKLKEKRASGDRLDRFQGRGVRDIIEATDELSPADENDSCAMQAIVETTCELTAHRTNRIELGERGLQGPFKSLVFFMSFALLGGILLFDVDQLWLHAVLVFVTTVAVAGLFLLLLDIDRPFSGLWSVGRESLKDIIRKLAVDSERDSASLVKEILEQPAEQQKKSKWIPSGLTMFTAGIVFLVGFSFWTWYLVRGDFSWWAIGTGFGAFSGLVWIISAYEEKSQDTATGYYCTKCKKRHRVTSAIGQRHITYKVSGEVNQFVEQISENSTQPEQ